MKFAKETVVIAAIGMIDLVTTIVFIKHHGAEEANPLFNRYWQMGIPAFVAAKCVMLFCPLMILEWARQRRPRFVTLALRSGIAGYVGMYAIGFAQLNARDQAVIKNAEQVMLEASRPTTAVEASIRRVHLHNTGQVLDPFPMSAR